MNWDDAMSDLVVDWVLIETFGRDSLGSGLGSHKCYCMFWVLGIFQGLRVSGRGQGLGWSGLVVISWCF